MEKKGLVCKVCGNKEHNLFMEMSNFYICMVCFTSRLKLRNDVSQEKDKGDEK